MENVSHNTSYDSADNLSRDPNQPVVEADYEGVIPSAAGRGVVAGAQGVGQVNQAYGRGTGNLDPQHPHIRSAGVSSNNEAIASYRQRR